MISQESRYLSLVLRHQPEKAGVKLDRFGWASVDDLITGVAKKYPGFDLQKLNEVVTTNNKKRFEFDPTRTMIRACQGHSIEVDLQLKPSNPPAVLFHGTAESNVGSILVEGIKAGRRQYVHLSDTLGTAFEVGRRHGTPVAITVLAEQMNDAGHIFMRSSNGVWLTDSVPTEFLGSVRHEREKIRKGS